MNLVYFNLFILVVAISNSSGYLELDLQPDYYGAVVLIQVDSNDRTIHVVLDSLHSQFYVPQIDADCYEDPAEYNTEDPIPLSSIPQGIDYTSTASTTETCTTFGAFVTSSSDTYIPSNETFSWVSPFYNFVFSDGTYGQDYIYIDGEEVGNLTFGVTDNSNEAIGKIGLGFPIDGKSILKQLISLNWINKSVYVLTPSMEPADGGTLLLGGIDHSRYHPPLKTIPMIDSPSFLVDSIAATVANISIINQSTSNGTALADTVINTDNYTTVFALESVFDQYPYSLFHEIGQAFNGIYNEETDTYNVSCSTSVQLKLDFNGISITLNNTSFVVPNWGDTCYLNMISWSEEAILLGVSVLANGYFVFDMEDREISIAPIKFSDDDPDIEAIVSTIPSSSEFSSQTTSTIDDDNFASSSISDSELDSITSMNSGGSTIINDNSISSFTSNSDSGASMASSTTSTGSTIKAIQGYLLILFSVSLVFMVISL